MKKKMKLMVNLKFYKKIMGILGSLFSKCAVIQKSKMKFSLKFMNLMSPSISFLYPFWPAICAKLSNFGVVPNRCVLHELMIIYNI
jgi:hypothetical protein